MLVVRGQISRYSSPDGYTSFILNECPRLVLNEVTGRIGTPVPLMKAVDQNKYNDYHLRYSSFDFAIPFTFDFRQRHYLQMPALCHNPNVHQEPKPPGSGPDLSNFKEEDREEYMAMRFPTNVNRTEDLATRFVDLQTERFKNKHVLLGGSKSFPRGTTSRVKLALSLN